MPPRCDMRRTGAVCFPDTRRTCGDGRRGVARTGETAGRGRPFGARAPNVDNFLTQNRGVLSEKSWSAEADQDFSSVLADWSGLGR
ncbi:hypothetical protein GCM10010326_73630 [Streptomyces xanthochromogenes]|uniref:Uncharacterized protein n=1 Tax=Streptomyces xanthochromogenes TaxID=67384 RepID=A0ABQ3AWH0_9ACTN|nr:hypothetical protein GCM10010326_73630 [Streptomyces xanthochromogenes]